MYEAVSTFNNGNISRLKKVLENLGIKIGFNTLSILKQLDEERIARAEFSENNTTNEARLKRRRGNLVLDEVYAGDYIPGAF